MKGQAYSTLTDQTLARLEQSTAQATHATILHQKQLGKSKL